MNITELDREPTDRELKALAYIAEYRAVHPISPTYDEVGECCGCKPSAAREHGRKLLSSLEAKGCIRLQDGMKEREGAMVLTQWGSFQLGREVCGQ